MELELDFEHNLKYKSNIGKYVKVKTVDSCEHEGWLKCIDPISGNFFLIVFDDSFMSVHNVILIMRDACTSMEVLKDSDENVKCLLESIFQDSVEPQEDVSARKQRVIAWIKKNRLPIVESEDESLIVGGNVTVKPPYDIQSCSSVNERTLKSIRQLVAKLPPDV